MTREELMTTDDRAGKIVAQFLLNYAEENNWDKIEKSGKSINDCMAAIRAEARKNSVQGVAVVQDEDVFNWAVHFYDESKNVPQTAPKETVQETKPKVTKPKVEKKVQEDEQLSLFDL